MKMSIFLVFFCTFGRFSSKSTTVQRKWSILNENVNFPSLFLHFWAEVDTPGQKNIEKLVLFAKCLPKSTIVQRFGRVRTLKYRFLQRKMRKMSAANYPGYPDYPVHRLLLGTYHPHAPESR